MIPRRLLPPLGATAALVLLGWAVPQPDLRIAFFVGSFVTTIWAIVCLFRDQEPKPRSMVEDDKHIVLFKEAPSSDTLTCPHCGEVIGLGIRVCPRCNRSTQ